MNRIDRQSVVKAMLDTSRSRFMSIEFVKKDGSLRRMVINPRSVAKRVVGDAASPSAKQAVATRKERHPNLIPVYEVGVGIRSVNSDTVQSVRMGGSVYHVV